MTSINVHISIDAEEVLNLLHIAGCYDGIKTRLYAAALEEGLKVLVARHGLSFMAQRKPLNELLAQAAALDKAGEVAA